MPIVLLRGCYAEMLTFTRQAFGVAPVSKLMYSSDGIGVPELHSVDALDGRRVLGELVACGKTDTAGAEAARSPGPCRFGPTSAF